MPPYVKALWDSAILYLVSGLSGGWAWVARIVLKYGGQYVYETCVRIYAKIKRAVKQNEAEKKYEDVVKNPASAVDERGKAYEDLINNSNK